MKAAFLTFLAALVLMTSTGLGFARGTLPADEGIVICHGNAAVTIWIDVHGNEVRHVHLCPDEGPFFKQGALIAPDLRSPDGIGARIHAVGMPAPVAFGTPPLSLARGPPFAV
ncbi:MAG: hypothetical protein AAGF78_11180 [Pseudomonadota bacterium]